MQISLAPGLASMLDAASHGQFLLALRLAPSWHLVLSTVAADESYQLPLNIEGSSFFFAVTYPIVIGLFARCSTTESPEAAAARVRKEKERELLHIRAVHFPASRSLYFPREKHIVGIQEEALPSVTLGNKELVIVRETMPSTRLVVFVVEGGSVLRQVTPIDPLVPTGLFLARCSFHRTFLATPDGDASALTFDAFAKSVAVACGQAELAGPQVAARLPNGQLLTSSDHSPLSTLTSFSVSPRGRSLLPEVPTTVQLLLQSPALSKTGSISFEPGAYREYTVFVDVLLYVDAAATVSTFVASLGVAVFAQLAAMSRLHPRSSCRALHFRPWRFTHPVTLLLPLDAVISADADASLIAMRKQLHVALGLPSDRPLLRIQQAIYNGRYEEQREATSQHLRNVHALIGPLLIGIDETSINVRVVEGDYDYYHYTQDSFDDKGWGCAYRSLQTLCSWFVLQRCVVRSIPTHREIQQALVDIGDKPKSIIGSTQWIGAVEVAYCLDRLLNVTARILRLNSGEEAVAKSAELLQHFEIEGTPVMIGGGVLAYTMLGVARFGDDVRFLILDPHYTGNPSNPKVIKDKGWCGWKKCGEIFKAGTFYNLCLPRRPREI